MRISRFGAKIATIMVVVVVVAVMMMNFDSIFTNLNCNALSIPCSTKSDLANIPSKINFIDDDKQAYVNYCKKLYGSTLPLKVDNNVYEYFGSVNGYRFYRLQPTYISYDSINQQKVIGGFTFESSYRYRPESTGLYIIGDKSVYTLEQAYNKSLVDISKVYELYIKKVSQ